MSKDVRLTPTSTPTHTDSWSYTRTYTRTYTLSLPHTLSRAHSHFSSGGWSLNVFGWTLSFTYSLSHSLLSLISYFSSHQNVRLFPSLYFILFPLFIIFFLFLSFLTSLPDTSSSRGVCWQCTVPQRLHLTHTGHIPDQCFIPLSLSPSSSLSLSISPPSLFFSPSHLIFSPSFLTHVYEDEGNIVKPVICE